MRLANRKGLLQGKLNAVQEEALQWLLVDEIEQQIALEKERMKYTVLAGNVALWQQLYGNDQDDEVPNDEDIEWVRPESAEDVEAMLSVLEATQVGSETF